MAATHLPSAPSVRGSCSTSSSPSPRRIVVALRAAPCAPRASASSPTIGRSPLATAKASLPSSPSLSPNHHRRCRVRALRPKAAASNPSGHSPSPSPSTDVVCVGEALFDLIADQIGVPRDQVTSWTGYPGGAPCNVATAAARLGCSAAFCSALGRDPQGDELLALLVERGVDVSAVQRPEGAPTRSVYVTRTVDGDREFSGFGAPTDAYSDCVLDAGAMLDDRPGAPGSAAALLLRQGGSRCLVTGTLGLAYPGSRRAIEAAAQAAREAGAVVLVDVNWRPVFWPPEAEGGGEASSSSSPPSSPSPRRVILDFLAKHADVVKVSDADLKYLCPGVTCEEALSNPCALLGGADDDSSSSMPLPRAAGVLVTAGEKGASYCFRAPSKGAAHSGFVPAYDVGVADTTGAGDAFTAGFLWWMLKNTGGGGEGGGGGGGGEGGGGGRDALRALQSDPAALADAVAFGAATGALTTTRPGAIASQPTLEEVMGLFENQQKGTSAAAPAA